MKGNKYISLILLVLISTEIMAQQRRFLGIRSYSGELGLSAFYKHQDRISPAITENEQLKNIALGLSLNAQSYVWTPKFMLVDLGLGYNPVSEQNLFLVTPDRNEIRTLKKLSFRTTFLADKPVSLQIFKTYNENFARRDLLTDVKYRSNSTGASFAARTKVLPLMVEYQQSDWSQEEIERGRTSENAHNMLWARTEKSFTRRDKTTLDYYHNEFNFKGFELNETRNTNHMLDVSNALYLDTLKSQGLWSKVNHIDQEGNQPFRRTQIFENLTVKLPARFTARGNYQYTKDIRPSTSLDMHTSRAQLNHQLFSSLRTSAYVERRNLTHTAFDEKNDRVGGTLNYIKQIKKGSLSLNYRYYRLEQEVDQKTDQPQIFDEQQSLFDNQLIFLNNPLVELNTVVVTDITGVVQYQENVDFLLFDRGEFTEIQRIPGGRIAEGETVLVDYVYRQNADYGFVLNYHSVGSELNLFDRLIQLYGQWNNQTYSHVDTSGFVVLKPFRDIRYGATLNYSVFCGGAEYQHFASPIGPFRMWRYHIQASGNIADRLLYSLTASRKRFVRLDQDRTEIYADLYGGLTWQINHRSKVDVNVGYRDQKGRQVDLELFTTRVQYSISFRLISINVGGAVFRRDYLEETMDYNNVYIQIMRRFQPK